MSNESLKLNEGKQISVRSPDFTIQSDTAETGVGQLTKTIEIDPNTNRQYSCANDINKQTIP